MKYAHKSGQSMFAKLFCMFMAVLLLALGGVGLTTYANMRNRQIDARLGELKKQAREIAYLASQNITPDQFKADLKAQSADQVKEELALEAWARHNNMEITDADVAAEFAKTGVEDPAALEQEWRDAGRLHLIRTGLLRQKAIEDLMENANVTEVDFAAKAAEEKKAAKKPAKKKAAKKDEAEEAAE